MTTNGGYYQNAGSMTRRGRQQDRWASADIEANSPQPGPSPATYVNQPSSARLEPERRQFRDPVEPYDRIGADLEMYGTPPGGGGRAPPPPPSGGSRYAVRERDQSFKAKIATSPYPANSYAADDLPPDPFAALHRNDQPSPRPPPPARSALPSSPVPSSRDGTLSIFGHDFNNVFTVTLRKKNNTFGFSIVGGVDNPKPSTGDTSIVISDVVPRSPAAEALLRSQDVILRMNDISFRNITRREANNHINRGPEEASFEIGRNPPSTLTLDRTGTLNSDSLKKVTLTKIHPNEDFGIRVGVKFFIRYIPKNSAASREGVLRPNDTILQVNGINISEMPLRDVRALINNHMDNLELLVDTSRNNQDLNTTTLSPTSYMDRSLALVNSAGVSQTDSGMASMTTDEDTILSPNRPPPPLLATPSMDEGGFQLYGANENSAPGESRVARFDGSRALGMRLAGGNSTGVFVMAVQEGSQSKRQNLVPGDQILQVADRSTENMTREEVLAALQQPKSQFDVVIKHNREGFMQFAPTSVSGDSFYVRAHFPHSPSQPGHLGFEPHDILHVTDSLPQGKDKEGFYIAARLNPTDRGGRENDKGLIPNKQKATELKAVANQTRSRGRSASLTRRGSKRFRSLSRGRSNDTDLDDMLRKGPSVGAYSAYERVKLATPSFLRPVVIYGPIGDVARERLSRDDSGRFVLPSAEDGFLDKENLTVTVATIRAIINQERHCLLDVSPGCVEWLNMVGLYPIVIFFKPDDKKHVKDVRSSFKSVRASSDKTHKKLYRVAVQIEKSFSHLFSETIHLTANTMWYTKLVDSIKKHQSLRIWMSESDLVSPASVNEVTIPVGQWATGASIITSKSTSSVNNHFNNSTPSAAGRRYQPASGSSHPDLRDDTSSMASAPVTYQRNSSNFTPTMRRNQGRDQAPRDSYQPSETSRYSRGPPQDLELQGPGSQYDTLVDSPVAPEDQDGGTLRANGQTAGRYASPDPPPRTFSPETQQGQFEAAPAWQRESRPRTTQSSWRNFESDETSQRSTPTQQTTWQRNNEYRPNSQQHSDGGRFQNQDIQKSSSAGEASGYFSQYRGPPVNL